MQKAKNRIWHEFTVTGVCISSCCVILSSFKLSKILCRSTKYTKWIQVIVLLVLVI